MNDAAFAVDRTALADAPPDHDRVCLELAVSLVNPASPCVSGTDQSARLAHWLAVFGDADLAEWLSGFTPSHLYIGSEFCEHLLPTAHTLRKAITRAQGMDCHVSLLTPIASPQVIRDLADVLPELPAGSEVIVNDWGVGYFVKNHFPRLRLVAGRILCRMMKDPRLNQAGATTTFRFDPRPLTTIFKRLGMERMEMDVPIFVDDNTFTDLPMSTSVHVPFSCVAKGRMCKVGSTAVRGPERFAVGRPCKKECIKVSAELKRPCASTECQTFQLGNTMISRHSKAISEIVRTAVARGFINRIIVPGEPI